MLLFFSEHRHIWLIEFEFNFMIKSDMNVLYFNIMINFATTWYAYYTQKNGKWRR